MILLFSGTPGSGKSLYATEYAYKHLKKKDTILFSNSPYKFNERYFYIDNTKFDTEIFMQYAKENPAKREGQYLIIIDEAQLLFNSRNFSSKDRMQWVQFFTLHRKLGFDIVLISQFDRMIDRQIRSLIEYEIKFRKVNRLAWFIPFPCFVKVSYWYGVNEKVDVSFFLYRKKYSKLYDTNLILQLNQNT